MKTGFINWSFNRKIYWSIILAATVILIIIWMLLPGPGSSGPSASITTQFGDPQNMCIGKGICSSAGVKKSSGASGLVVNFINLNDNTGRIVMTFSLDSLYQYQRDQYKSFVSQAPDQPQPSYIFEFPYDISPADSLFGALQLKAGALISSASSSTLAITKVGTGYMLSDTIMVAYAQPAMANVIFGGNNAAGEYDGMIKGIFAISANPIPAVPPVPASIPVSFTLQPGNAGNLVMVFSQHDLETAQPMQVNYFNSPNGSYIFSAPAPLSPNIFSATGLPANAIIGPLSRSVLSQGNGADTDVITYNLTITPHAG